MDPKFKLKQVFPSFIVLKKAIRKYSVKHKLGVQFKKNDNDRVQVICVDGCPWSLTGRKFGEVKCQIRKLNDEHKCYRQRKLHWATFKCIEYLENIRSNPSITLGALVEHI